MKKVTITATILLLIVLSAQTLLARDEFTRTVKREYNVNPDAQLIVDNKFGKIHCTNWDKNVIAIEVTITVVAPDEAAASKMMDRVTFSLSGTPERVEARTMIDDSPMKKQSQMSIDYSISLPASVNVDLTNKFGNIYVNEVNGKAKFNLSYGDMDVRKLNNSDNLIDVKFGNANIGSIKGAVTNLKYSEMDLEYAGSMRLDSKFSNLSANKIVALNTTFEGGKLDLENTSAIEGKTKFSDLSIGNLDKSLDLDIQYGTCDIENIPADFTSINIINKYGDVNLGIPENASYSLEADLKFCEIDFPEDKADFREKSSSPTSRTIRATVGGQGGSKITVRSDFGNVSLH